MQGKRNSRISENLPKSDFHIHSHFSGDSAATVSAMCAAAAQKGFGAVCFTDHHDMGMVFPVPFTIDEPAKYAVEILAARKNFPEIEVLLGVELGVTALTEKSKLAFLDELPLDYLLLSCHDAGGIDPSEISCFDGRTRAQVVEAYFKSIYAGVTLLDSFDAIAHIGYVYRYLGRYRPYGDTGLRYEKTDAPDLLEAILKKVISSGAVLELNMSEYANGMTMPPVEIIKQYARLGGEAMIYGSDAHRPEDIGRHFHAALEIMKDCGIKYLASFRERKRTLTRI